MTGKEDLAAALRAYIDNIIDVADIEDLAVFSDTVWLAGESIEGIDAARRQALIDAGRQAFVEITDATAKPIPPAQSSSFRVMTPIEQSDFMAIVESIQQRPGESWDDWQARYRQYEETGETEIPDDVRQRLRRDGESLEAYLERMKSGEGGDET